VNVSKKTKPFLLVVLLIAVVVLPLTVYFLQKEQIFQNFAWETEQSAQSECSSSSGTAVINVTFTNTESSTSQDMNVTVTDIQTGASLDMGTVKAKETKTMTLDTKKTSLNKGTVIFNLSWAGGAPGTDTESATYNAVSTCPVPTPGYCSATGQANEGYCEWDSLSGAQGYNVVVKEVDTGTIVQSINVSNDATESAFPMTPGEPYQCTVTPTNECGNGTPATSPQKICQQPTPTPTSTPTPMPSVCSPTEGTCSWNTLQGATSYIVTVTDTTLGQTVNTGTVQAPGTSFSFPDNGTDTYVCRVSATNVCGQSPPSNSPPDSCTQPTPTPTVTPVPTNTPIPTPTSVPTVTPTPRPTATPVPPTPTPEVTVIVLTQPPQQVVQTIPGGTQTIVRQQPGQTQTIIQPGPTQTVYISPNKPTPTMPPTGSTTPTYVLAGTSLLLLLAGGLIFFVL
jgi:hypothetical protein